MRVKTAALILSVSGARVRALLSEGRLWGEKGPGRTDPWDVSLESVCEYSQARAGLGAGGAVRAAREAWVRSSPSLPCEKSERIDVLPW